MDILQDLLYRLIPNQSGLLCIGILVAFLVFGNLEKLRSRRNLVLAGLFAMAPLLTDILDPSGGWRFKLAFEIIFVLLFFYVVWSYRLSRDSRPTDISPHLNKRALRTLLVAFLVLDAVVVFGRPPEDSGIYSNLAAARWVETGRLPYGDPALRGPDGAMRGAAATYGPLLIAAHVPFQVALGTKRNPPDTDPRKKEYLRPPDLASQLVCYLFFLIAIWALYRTVRRETGIERGLGAAILLASSPYLLGMGSDDRWPITGFSHISHIAPSAAILVALCALPRPWLAGALLAASVGLLFWPVFALPAWFGWYFWRRKGAIEFLGGFLAISIVLALTVATMTDPWGNDGIMRTFFDATLGHQEGTPRQYGSSDFGFWGTHPVLAALLHSPLFASVLLSKPTFLAFASLSVAGFFLARARSVAQLAALTAMIAAAMQFWKTHAGGTYVEWFFPFLLVALMAHPALKAAPGKTNDA